VRRAGGVSGDETPPEDSAELRPGREGEFLIVGRATHETLPYVFDQHGARSGSARAGGRA
jgi:hypothetical protein